MDFLFLSRHVLVCFFISDDQIFMVAFILKDIGNVHAPMSFGPTLQLGLQFPWMAVDKF
jgi:hypothetical protein